MKLDALRLFIAIVDEGSLSAAGRRLGLPRSVVSDRLQELERETGVRLLHRSTRASRPTDAGSSLYTVAARTISDLDEAISALAERRGELCGSIRVAAPLVFGVRHLCPNLNSFLMEHPNVTLDLDLNDRLIDLTAEGIDLAIRVGELTDSALISRRLATSRRVVVASPAYAEANELPTTVLELEHHPSVSYSNIRPRDEWQFQRVDGSEVVVRPKPRVRVNNGEAQLRAVEAGLGLAVLPTFIVFDAIKAGAVIQVNLDMQPVPDPIHAIYHPSRHISARILALTDHIARALAKPGWDFGSPAVNVVPRR
jgi:DNA-binding transcriptional LysR family regulator